MLQAVFSAFKIPDLRRKIIFTVLMLLVFRVIAHIPVPGVDLAAPEQLLQQNRTARHAEPLLRQRAAAILDRRDGGLSLHHGDDHLPTPDPDHPAPGRTEQRGRVGPRHD
ncbi:MAG: hypothetical protein U0232_07605 [Thermomicrobiales bacterium]